MKPKQSIPLQEYVIFNTVTRDAPHGRDFVHLVESKSKKVQEIIKKCESGEMAEKYPKLDHRIADNPKNWILKEDVDEDAEVYSTDEFGFVKVPKIHMKDAQLVYKRLKQIDKGVTVSPLGAALDPIKEEAPKEKSNTFREKLRDALRRGLTRQ